jgi:hypothetical protein
VKGARFPDPRCLPSGVAPRIDIRTGVRIDRVAFVDHRAFT